MSSISRWARRSSSTTRIRAFSPPFMTPPASAAHIEPLHARDPHFGSRCRGGCQLSWLKASGGGGGERLADRALDGRRQPRQVHVEEAARDRRDGLLAPQAAGREVRHLLLGDRR